MAQSESPFSRLPSVDSVLSSNAGLELCEDYSRLRVAEAVREAIGELRRSLKESPAAPDRDFSVETISAAAKRRLDTLAATSIRSVVNATGVVLHTNLGRALLAPEAVEAATRAASRACNLEYDLGSGGRGERDTLVEQHICALTGAEAATVVNNNAAAVLLVLNSLAEGREVLVSRGELIEIGGSFRIPDIMAKSGALMREIGTTNRTHLYDYENALGAQTALLLKVHSSNYRIVGFSSSVELAQLAELAGTARGARDRGAADAGADRGRPLCPGPYVFEDLGAGALIDLSGFGLPAEPVVADRIAAGADLLSFSGDKLLGGPQCGIIVGRRDLLQRLRRNPLKRALRCDKMTLAALEATLRIYRFARRPERVLPVLRHLMRPLEELRELGREAADKVAAVLGGDFCVELEDSEACTGSGSQPEVSLPSLVLSISSGKVSADAIARRFRGSDPPIIGRIEKDRFLLDLRCVDCAEDLVPA